MKFKPSVKQLTFFAALLAIYLMGCDKKDSNTAFGFNYVYMPQATVSGGTNLNYLVPSGLDTNTYNYKIDAKNNKVNVYLGVSCSGKVATAGYTVSVTTRSDTIATLISSGAINVAPNATKAVVLLPNIAYTLPATVTVPAGEYRADFNLAIDLTMLKTYAGKKVALCVMVSNPTNYMLNNTANKVVIIIDVDALKLT
ncbi:MAG: DUF1735 domain-containing protein [Sphingobacteriaceae bacterium]|nr:MAG: DUF1735 domain-containing protein [Sphingobacteriaceae bacterium]